MLDAVLVKYGVLAGCTPPGPAEDLITPLLGREEPVGVDPPACPEAPTRVAVTVTVGADPEGV